MALKYAEAVIRNDLHEWTVEEHGDPDKEALELKKFLDWTHFIPLQPRLEDEARSFTFHKYTQGGRAMLFIQRRKLYEKQRKSVIEASSEESSSENS